jgi:hypothetical protein
MIAAVIPPCAAVARWTGELSPGLGEFVTSLNRFDRKLEIGSVRSACVNDVLTAVLGSVVAYPGHHRPHPAVRAYDQPELLARVEHQTHREKVDLNLRDLSRTQLLDPIEAVSRDGIR